MKSVVVSLAFACLATSVLAGSGAGAIVMAFNPDARTEGMGGAGGAVWWGEAPEPWHNPALLGYHRGLGFHSMHSELAVGLADDIRIDADRFTLGYAGLGVVLQAGPVETYLDMGTQTATDEEGDPVGTFDSWERSRGIGVGFSLGEFLQTVSAEDSPAALIGRHLDLAGGYVRKSFEDRLASDDVLQDGAGGSAEATMSDYGVLGRLTFYDSLTGPGYLPGLDRVLRPLVGGLRVSAAWGRSWLSWGDEVIVHVDADQADPLPREHRESRSLRVEVGLPGAVADALPPLLATALSPAFAYADVAEDRWPGFRWDEDAGEYVYEEDDRDVSREELDGHEITILGVYTLRQGHVKVPWGDVDGDTDGWGVGLDLDVLRVRYDEASRPQAQGLPSVDVESWSVIVDGVALLERMR